MMPAMDNMISDIILIILAYLMGSVASAVLICKLLGCADPRTRGSGNPGATNVLRLYGKKAALLTLAGDVLKGVIPVLLARAWSDNPMLVALAGLAAFSGHLFPVFFRFRGGKGVATLIGVLFATHWLLGLAYVANWLMVAAVFRYASLAALWAAVFIPFCSWLILQGLVFVAIHGMMAGLLMWRHRSNIRRLMDGTESRLGRQ